MIFCWQFNVALAVAELADWVGCVVEMDGIFEDEGGAQIVCPESKAQTNICSNVVPLHMSLLGL